jgi:hypothetical protein
MKSGVCVSCRRKTEFWKTEVASKCAQCGFEQASITYSDLAMEIPSTLLELYETNTALVSSLRVSVISFNIEAKTVLPLGIIPKLASLPESLQPGYRTYFGELFEELSLRIRKDFETLSETHIVSKPSVLIVTDGIPSDEAADREASYRKLGLEVGGQETVSDFPCPPQIIIFGIGDADMTKIGMFDTTGVYKNHKIRRAGSYGEVSNHIRDIADWLQMHVASSLAEPNIDPKKPWLNPAEDDIYENPWTDPNVDDF